VIVTEVALRNFRSYEREQLVFPPGLTVIAGPNGVGKTNLLEAVCVATQGTSLRTTRDARVIRFGRPAARVTAEGARGSSIPFSTDVTIERGGSKRILFNGVALGQTESLRKELPVLAFTPDRLAVIKGPPAVRRIALDRTIGRLFPARESSAADYARALTQRNAALRRIRAGLSTRAALEPWNESLARLGELLEDSREAVVGVLQPHFAQIAESLGLPDAVVAYPRSELSVGRLEGMLERDVERATTGVGPHLQDVTLVAAGRDLRTFGSQGEQRLGVLALLLAEGVALADHRGEPPLLLLDDVLSELDERRRRTLLESPPAGAQSLITTTSVRALPEGVSAALVVDVELGRATPR
jgi:DNA replication and repair protein RecF